MGFNVREEYLFQQQDFIGHSGKPLTWKIECDAIQDVEWATIAHIIQELRRSGGYSKRWSKIKWSTRKVCHR